MLLGPQSSRLNSLVDFSCSFESLAFLLLFFFVLSSF
jgi:hypothetical protein